jgi:hypothetical protein
MKPRPLTLTPTIALLVIACSLLVAAPAGAAESKVATSDLTPPAKRQASVDLAVRLTRPPTPAPLPPDLPQPFSPVDFDKPGPDEGNVAGAGAAAAHGGGASAASGAAAAASAAPTGPVGDRAILESLAAKIPSQGSIIFGGKRLLLVGKNRLEIGTTITVTDKATNQYYELQLVAIDATTFTLRYRGEDVTRPIKSVK